MKRIAVAGGVASTLAVAILLLVGRDDDPVSRPRGQPAPVAAETTIEGGSGPERDLAAAVVDRMRPTRLRHIRLAPPRPHPPWSLPPHGVEMDVRTTRPRSLRGVWEANVVARAYAVRAGARRVRPLAWVQEGDAGWPVTPAELPRAAPASGAAVAVARLLRKIRRTTSSSGAVPVELRILRPAWAAVAVTLRSSEPARFLVEDVGRIARLLQAAPPRVAATYLGVEDEHHEIVWAVAAIRGRGGPGRLGSVGMLYVRPDLDQCSPVPHGGSFGRRSPPACPYPSRD